MVDQEKMVDVDKDMNPILNKDNNEYWKTMTEASLVFLDCWDAVEPGLTAAERLRPDCIKMDNKARVYIFQHVRPEYLGDIRALKIAREYWKALEDVHGRSTSMDIVLCMRELGTIEKIPSMDISTYCGIDKDLTARVVKSDLLLEERRIDAAADSSEQGDDHKTMETKPQQNKDGTKPKNRDPHYQRCYKYGKMGHISYQCQEEKGDKEERNQREKKKQEDNKREKGSEDKPSPRNSYRHWLCLPSATWIEGGSVTLTQVPQII